MLPSEKYGNIEIIISHLINIINIKKSNESYYEESIEELFCIFDFNYYFENIDELSQTTKQLIKYIAINVPQFFNKFNKTKSLESYLKDESWMNFTEFLIKPTTLLIIQDLKRAGFKTDHLENRL